MKLSILIIFYDTAAKASATLQSILTAETSHLESIHITLWNNGPKHFSQHEIDDLTTVFKVKDISCTLYNSIHNFSLAKIYNFVLQQSKDYSHTIFFDDDTTLPHDFFIKLSAVEHADMILPLVFETQIQTFLSPSIKGKSSSEDIVISTEGEYTGGEIFFINSGLCLSRNFAVPFNRYNGYIFNEAFALDAVDTCLCHDLHTFLKTVSGLSIVFTNTIQHTISVCSPSFPHSSPSRLFELICGRLLLRLHTRKSRRSALSYVFRKCKRTLLRPDKLYLIAKCIITKRHPRNTPKQDTNFSHTVKQQRIQIH